MEKRQDNLLNLGEEMLLWVDEVGSEDVGKEFCGGVRLMMQGRALGGGFWWGVQRIQAAFFEFF